SISYWSASIYQRGLCRLIILRRRSDTSQSRDRERLLEIPPPLSPAPLSRPDFRKNESAWHLSARSHPRMWFRALAPWARKIQHALHSFPRRESSPLPSSMA